MELIQSPTLKSLTEEMGGKGAISTATAMLMAMAMETEPPLPRLRAPAETIMMMERSPSHGRGSAPSRVPARDEFGRDGELGGAQTFDRTAWFVDARQPAALFHWTRGRERAHRRSCFVSQLYNMYYYINP